jgi:DNA polymerase-3 subunit alpha
VFPRTMSEINHLLNDDAIVVCKVRVDKRDDLPKLIIMELDLFDAEVSDTADPVNVQLPEGGLPDDKFTALRELLAEYPGKSEVFIYLGEVQYKLPGDMRVDSRSGLVGELRVLLGPDAIRL